MIGERIKICRRIKGFSQRKLAEAAGISAMAVSKYERGLDVPGSAVLIRLAKSLGVNVEYFFRPVQVTMTIPSYRCKDTLPQNEKESILASTLDWLERYVELESVFPDNPGFSVLPDEHRRIESLHEIEKLAVEFRRSWNIGLGPIENLIEIIEDQGIRINAIEAHEDFDAITAWTSDSSPLIVIKKGVPGDRQRFSLAHELGHMLLKPASEINIEKAANRFAGAFLVPEPAVLFELGSTRQKLSLYELHSLKHKYGLSMQGWIHRAEHLEIISKATAKRMLDKFHQEGWNLTEPGDQIPSEEPARMQRLVMRALSEALISESRAAELLGMPFAAFCRKQEQEHAFAIDICA